MPSNMLHSPGLISLMLSIKSASICINPLPLILLLQNVSFTICRVHYHWVFASDLVLHSLLPSPTLIGLVIRMIAVLPLASLCSLVITPSPRFLRSNTQSHGLPLRSSIGHLPLVLQNSHGYVKFCVILA